MQINLPDEVAPLVQQKATAAGFAGRIDAYVAHLIAADDVEDYGAPAHLSVAGKSREEIDVMIAAGIENGPATPMTADDWRALHARLDQLGQSHS
jgi:hypothetical protein